MKNIVTLGQINDALKIASVTAAQLAEMGFAALENKPICEALPPEESRRLRNAKLYPVESIAQIRVALAKRLAAPACSLLQIQEPATPAAIKQGELTPTMFWDADEPESCQTSINNVVVEVDSYRGLKVGDEVLIQRAVSLSDITVRITMVPDSEGIGDLEWVEITAQTAQQIQGGSKP